MLLAMFIIGHMEIGGGYCRTDLMMDTRPISMEYPCEYYPELLAVDLKLKEIKNAKTY